MAGPEAISSRGSTDLQKTPPNSIEAEEALLGSALLSRDCLLYTSDAATIYSV